MRLREIRPLQGSLRRALTTSAAVPAADYYASRERSIRSQLREWYLQRQGGNKYLLWKGPRVLFAKLEQYHWDVGPKSVPKLSDWWFDSCLGPESAENLDADEASKTFRFNQATETSSLGNNVASTVSQQATNLVIGCSLWTVARSKELPLQNWVSVEDNDLRLFHALVKAFEVHDVYEPDKEEPLANLRFLFTNPWLVHRFLPRQSQVDRVFLFFRADFCDLIRGVSEVLKIGGELIIVAESDSDIREAAELIFRETDPKFENDIGLHRSLDKNAGFSNWKVGFKKVGGTAGGRQFGVGLLEETGLRPPGKREVKIGEQSEFNNQIFLPKSPAARFHALDPERKTDIWAQIRGELKGQRKERWAEGKKGFMMQPVSFLGGSGQKSLEDRANSEKTLDESEKTNSEKNRNSNFTDSDSLDESSSSTGEKNEVNEESYSQVRRFYFLSQWIRRGAKLPNARFRNPGNPIAVERRPKSVRA